mmetsp:Transcript_49579/g.160698  ORF Transcript_49579/g.160698 Transcript_49579/m.160698 type:complete len:229 (-) Transcript_49579:602-1288(-)
MAGPASTARVRSSSDSDISRFVWMLGRGPPSTSDMAGATVTKSCCSSAWLSANVQSMSARQRMCKLKVWLSSADDETEKGCHSLLTSPHWRKTYCPALNLKRRPLESLSVNASTSLVGLCARTRTTGFLARNAMHLSRTSRSVGKRLNFQKVREWNQRSASTRTHSLCTWLKIEYPPTLPRRPGSPKRARRKRSRPVSDMRSMKSAMRWPDKPSHRPRACPATLPPAP